jgi:hypothetical protein
MTKSLDSFLKKVFPQCYMRSPNAQICWPLIWSHYHTSKWVILYVNMWLAAFCLTKSLLCNVAILLGVPFISESSFQKCASRSSKKILCRFQVREFRSQASVWTAQSCVWMPISVQKFWIVQGCIRSGVSATRPNAHHCLTRNRLSFLDTDMGRQLHPSGRQGNTVWTLSLIRKERGEELQPSGRSLYYGIYVQHKCNRPEARATLSGRSPDMVLCEAHYGKPVALLSVWKASACVRTPPREIRDILNLGLLSL